MPEIGKFEDKIIAFDMRIVQQERILHRFDELMSTKASKIQIKDLYNHMEDTYGSRNDQLVFIEETNDRMKQISDKTKQMKSVMDNMGKNFGYKIISEVKKATNHLKHSIFDEESPKNIVNPI